MILVGNQRGGAYDLARHLMKEENEQVTVHEIRGFVSRTLEGAFQESYAISRATKCKQHLYSLSLNPPQGAEAEEADYVNAANAVEEQLGLQGQPRAIVFHEKIGQDGILRRHAHAVWCRIDRKEMKAINMSFDRDQLRTVARGLFIEHAWQMPLGFVKTEWRDPRNFTLAEWQQAKRAGKDAARLKAMFQERWAISDSKASFAHALEEQGFILAKGDRRGIVAVDHEGEAYAITRWVGVKSKQVRTRLGEPDIFPSVSEARNKAAQLVATRLKELEHEQEQKAQQEKETASQNLKTRQQVQKMDFLRLQLRQKEQERKAGKQRQARIRKGILGFLDLLTGKRKKIIAHNQREAEQAQQRDQTEQANLRQTQAQVLKAGRNKAKQQTASSNAIRSALQNDIRWLETPFKNATKGNRPSSRKLKEQREQNMRKYEPEP